MHWEKLSETNKPPFGEMVFLMEYDVSDREDSLVNAGSLLSIDVNGFNWNTGNPFANIFGGRGKRDFVPTHFALITMPEEV